MCQPCVQAARKRVIRLKKEKQIQKVKTENHLGYPEARRLVEGATPSPGAKTYAAASRVSTRTVDCQTDITWLSRERPLAMNSGKSQTPVSTHHSTDTQTTHSIPQTSAPTSAPPQTAQSPSRNAQHGRPQPGAGAVGSQSKPKKKPKMDRLPKDCRKALLRRPIGFCFSRTTPERWKWLRLPRGVTEAGPQKRNKGVRRLSLHQASSQPFCPLSTGNVP